MPKLSDRDSKLKGQYKVDETGRLRSPGIARPDGLVPVGVKLPSVNDLLDLSIPELVDVLQRYGIVASWADAKARAAKVIADLNGIPSGPLFDARMRALTTDNQLALVGQARRTMERYTTVQAMTGDENQEFIRLPEDYDESRICDACYELAGTIGTMAQHEEVGLPGAASCLGGDLCRCTLVPIE